MTQSPNHDDDDLDELPDDDRGGDVRTYPVPLTAAEWLTTELADGPIAEADVFERARRAGFRDLANLDETATIRRAGHEIGAEVFRGRNGEWFWRLPSRRDEPT